MELTSKLCLYHCPKVRILKEYVLIPAERPSGIRSRHRQAQAPTVVGNLFGIHVSEENMKQSASNHQIFFFLIASLIKNKTLPSPLVLSVFKPFATCACSSAISYWRQMRVILMKDELEWHFAPCQLTRTSRNVSQVHWRSSGCLSRLVWTQTALLSDVLHMCL